MGSGNKDSAPEAPKAPVQQIKTYDNGFGDTATQDKFNPSAYNQQQMAWTEQVMPQIQNKLFDQNGADSQARAYADNLKAQGMKSFKQQADDLYGGYVADGARRFGTLDSSSNDSNMKRFGQATQEGLQEVNNNYDANYQNALNNYQSYYTNMLATPQTIQGNLYNLANGQSQNALSSSNSYNNFANQQYQSQLALYNAQQQLKNQQQAGMMSRFGSALGGVR